MPFLYLPKSKKSLVAELIQHIDEVDVMEDDPTRKNGKRTVAGVNVTMIGAHLIEEVIEADETQEVPFYDTFTGSDAEVLMAWRNAHLLRLLPSGVADTAIELPLPKSAETQEEVKV